MNCRGHSAELRGPPGEGTFHPEARDGEGRARALARRRAGGDEDGGEMLPGRQRLLDRRGPRAEILEGVDVEARQRVRRPLRRTPAPTRESRAGMRTSCCASGSRSRTPRLRPRAAAPGPGPARRAPSGRGRASTPGAPARPRPGTSPPAGRTPRGRDRGPARPRRGCPSAAGGRAPAPRGPVRPAPGNASGSTARGTRRSRRRAAGAIHLVADACGIRRLEVRLRPSPRAREGPRCRARACGRSTSGLPAG